MNNIVNRRRVISEDRDNIPIPTGWKLGQYFNVTSHTYASLHTMTKPYEMECLVATSTTSGNAMIVGFNGFLSIGRTGAKVQVSDSIATAADVFVIDEPVLLRVTSGTSSADADNHNKLYINGEDSGLDITKASQTYVNAFAGTKFAYGFKGRIYWIKLYKDGKIAHWYIPVKDNNDVSKCYDVISKGTITPTAGTFNVVL